MFSSPKTWKNKRLCYRFKKAVIGTLWWRCSKEMKQREMEIEDDEPVCEIGEEDDGVGTVSLSPLWQRRILMGEKCELPRFSGLILYDENGRPLRHASTNQAHQQEKEAGRVTRIKDLLLIPS